MKDEIQEYREKGILQRPVEIYLDHCKRYASSYLQVNKIRIQDYRFSKLELQNKVVTKKFYEILSLQEADFGPMSLTDQEIQN